MALINVAPTGAVSQPDKTIALFVSGNINLYTVPEGRKFEGFLNTSYSSHTHVFDINSVPVYFSGTYTPHFPVSLLGGDVVRTVSYAGSIFGVESDA